MNGVFVGETREKRNNDVNTKLLARRMRAKDSTVKSITDLILDRRIVRNAHEELILKVLRKVKDDDEDRFSLYFDVNEMFGVLDQMKIRILNRMLDCSSSTRPKRSRPNALSVDFDQLSFVTDDRLKRRDVRRVFIAALRKKIRITFVKTIFVRLNERRR